MLRMQITFIFLFITFIAYVLIWVGSLINKYKNNYKYLHVFQRRILVGNFPAYAHQISFAITAVLLQRQSQISQELCSVFKGFT